MAYRKKEDWLREAERLGIDASGLDWPALQKTVSRALKMESLGASDMDGDDVVLPSTRMPVEDMAAPVEGKRGIAGKLRKALSPEELKLKKFRGQEMKLAPEIYPNAQRAIHYKEDLGDEVLVEEKHYDIRGLEFNAGKNVDTGTYVIKGRTGDRVVATSAIPKEQPALYFRPDMDYAIVVEFMNRVGYLWTHQRLLNIKALLKESGYYEEYKGMFRDEPNIWYSCGLLCCDPSVVHHVFDEIEEKERIKRERGY